MAEERPFDRIKAGLLEAVAFARGEDTGCIVHTPESIMRRRKQRHRERANLRVVEPALAAPAHAGEE